MTSLIVLVCMYMLVSIGIGLWAARRVNNTADYAFSRALVAFDDGHRNDIRHVVWQ